MHTPRMALMTSSVGDMGTLLRMVDLSSNDIGLGSEPTTASVMRLRLRSALPRRSQRSLSAADRGTMGRRSVPLPSLDIS